MQRSARLLFAIGLFGLLGVSSAYAQATAQITGVAQVTSDTTVAKASNCYLLTFRNGRLAEKALNPLSQYARPLMRRAALKQEWQFEALELVTAQCREI